MTLGFLSGSKNFCKLLRVSWEVFDLHGTTASIGWLNPAPRVHIDDCFEIHNLHWELCDRCCNQINKIFCTKYDFASTSSARSPSNFSPLTDLAISVFREMSINTVLTQNRTSRWRRLKRRFMRETGVWASAFRNSIIHHIFSVFLQPLRDFRTCATWVGKQPVLSWSPFYLLLGIFGWLGDLARDWIHGKQRVSPFYRQHWNLTQARERNQFHFDPLFLESHCRLMLQ